MRILAAVGFGISADVATILIAVSFTAVSRGIRFTAISRCVSW